jgi:hypothetical protein
MGQQDDIGPAKPIDPELFGNVRTAVHQDFSPAFQPEGRAGSAFPPVSHLRANPTGTIQLGGTPGRGGAQKNQSIKASYTLFSWIHKAALPGKKTLSQHYSMTGCFWRTGQTVSEASAGHVRNMLKFQ